MGRRNRVVALDEEVAVQVGEVDERVGGEEFGDRGVEVLEAAEEETRSEGDELGGRWVRWGGFGEGLGDFAEVERKFCGHQFS